MLTPVLIGGLSIGVDATYWRYRVSVLQNAADMAALSLAVDVSNSILNTPTLTVNARNEARKNGCTTSCNINVTYPYSGNAQTVFVSVSDPSATRFFSWMYEATDRAVSGQAAARVGTAPAAGGSGSSCILLLSSATASAFDVAGASPRTTVNGCEVTVNSSNSAGTRVTAGLVDARVTTPGGISYVSGGQVSDPRPLQLAVSDPYTAFMGGSTGVFALNQFTTNSYRNITVNYTAAECIERLTTSKPVALDFTNDLSTFIPTAVARGYTTSINGFGYRVHNLGGGGGRFCAQVNLPSNVILNLGPGPWFFNHDVTLTTGSIIGTSTISTAIHSSIPRAAAQLTNGTTLIFGEGTFSFVTRATLNLVAPTSGPYAGFAVALAPDRAGNAPMNVISVPAVSSPGSDIRWTGLFYMPNRVMNVNSPISSLPASDGLVSSGCSQLILSQLVANSSILFGDQCMNRGLRTWGSDTTKGWTGTGGGPGSTVRARLLPIP